MEFLFLDFEFKTANEKHPTLVCAVFRTGSGQTTRLWLADRPDTQQRLKKLLSAISLGRDVILVCYNALAEARCLEALGLDPADFIWADLMVMWRLYKNEHPEFPKIKGVRGGDSFLDCCSGMKVRADTDVLGKEIMRDRILSTEVYTEKDQQDILDYCQTDVLPMPELAEKLFYGIQKEYGGTTQKVSDAVFYLSSFVVAMAKCETEGIPLNMEYVKNLSKNHEGACNKVIELCNKIYPFYEKTNKGVWKKTYKLFWNFVTNCGIADKWKRTPKGNYSSASEYLNKMGDKFPEISTLLETQQFLSHIRWFRPAALPEFNRHVGSDDRIRPFFNPYGTLSGRNAPPARSFPFAMSSWLRCLIIPPPGWVITEMDYSNQEYYIGAKLSGDKNMLAAYLLGDPYLYFGKQAGVIPPEGTKETYPKERQMFKSTVLGLQYGMGVDKLADRLTHDLNEQVHVSQAEKLLLLHHQTFIEYWRWLDTIELRSMRRDPLILADGWGLHTGSVNRMRTYKNFMVQGSGAVVLRMAVLKAQIAGLRVVAPVHDSIIILHAENDTEAPKILRKCMEEAITLVTGSKGEIRIDETSHRHGEDWITDKGRDMYNILKIYLQSDAQ
jgi:DNA polymerase-1